MEKKSQAILIAGMHRSGTSLSTNLLRDSGLFVGESLMDGGFDNKKGHFEDYEFVKIHERDLTWKGLESTGLKNVHTVDLKFEKETLIEIKKLLEKRSKHELWGWKDPRSTLYMLEWKRIIPDLKVIAIHRDADEVVNSLMRRYKYKIKNQVNYNRFRRALHFISYPIYSKYLKYSHYKSWVIYNQNILKFKELYPNDIVLYDLNDFIANYNDRIDAINVKFSISLNHYDINSVYNSKEMSKGEKMGKKLFSQAKLNRVREALNTTKSE